MPYYHDLVTEQSWLELQALRKEIKFLLIGGWATYLYTKTLRSKDIDIIVDFSELSLMNKLYSLNKNERLKKYEAVKGPVQIDIYLPHYSEIGIPVEILKEHPRETEGFYVLDPDYLLALKIYVLSRRAGNPKGEKDLLDCLALVRSRVTELKKVAGFLRTYHLMPAKQAFLQILRGYREAPELDMNSHQLARLKKKIFAMFT